MLTMSEFSVWFRNKYFDWEKSNSDGIEGITKFAEWLDVRQPYVSAWMSGRYRPGTKFIQVLADKLGPEVYNALGLEKPVFYSLPDDFRERLGLAIRETNETLSADGVEKNIEEATKITTDIFARHGFRYTGKDKEKTGSKK